MRAWQIGIAALAFGFVLYGCGETPKTPAHSAAEKTVPMHFVPTEVPSCAADLGLVDRNYGCAEAAPKEALSNAEPLPMNAEFIACMNAPKQVPSNVAPGADKTETTAKTETQPDAKPGAAPAGTTVTFGKDNEHSVVIPAAWTKETPTNNMRLLQIKIPKQGTDTEDSELLVFGFSAGGGVDANLTRWEGQMGGAGSLKVRRTSKTAAGKDATVAELEGTYTAMTDGAPKEKSGFKMLGAIIMTETTEIYVKLIGPANTIDANKAAFDKMIESFK